LRKCASEGELVTVTLFMGTAYSGNERCRQRRIHQK
jgi:hypothetical protein